MMLQQAQHDLMHIIITDNSRLDYSSIILA
ncbi:hypothetical protein QF023_000973 [Chryseobacterium sp. SLBN-27]|nr:hypothetical protein [Chryseobacterium sp. SLBN-27]